MSATTVYDFEAQSITGKPAHLSTQRGKVLLIVNTASACGFTPQFAGLEKLWEDYRDRGLVIVGFPSNQFGGQDPGTNDEIASFCQVNYGVSFPMMAKVDVNGQRPSAVEVAHGRGAGAAGHAGREVELHQVPRRPRRQGAQALRPQRRAGEAARRHRKGTRRLTPCSSTSSRSPATPS
jgi:Glutathione peroxidase